MRRSSKILDVGLPGLLLFAYLVALLWRFTAGGDLYLSYFTDDFYYYVEIARHLACCGVSTFNGFQLTNGYHPLWALVLAVLYRITDGGLPFFVATVLVIWLLVVGTFWQFRRIQRALLPAAPLNLATAMVSIAYMAVLARTGMEIAIALFFLAMFWQRMAACPLEEQQAGQALISGLLASLVILSRIDAVIAVAIYGALALLAPSRPRGIVLRNGVFFAIGLAPVVVYLAINQVTFDTLLPVSGLAKNLKDTLMPSASTVQRLLARDQFNLLFTWPSIALGALYVLRRRWRIMAPAERVRLCVIAHPVLFYLTLSFSSDWPLWTWYLYPLVPIAAVIGPAALSGWLRPEPGIGRIVVNAVVGVVLICLMAPLGRLNPEAVSIYDAAKRLQAFAATHPGRYAMGDRAGTPAYLMGQPVLQLEGLMADRPFLERIRNRQNVVQALRDLGVDYYIATDAHADGPCFVVREPAKAGPRSPAMTGHLCAHPLLSFDIAGLDTDVFAVTSLGNPTETAR